MDAIARAVTGLHRQVIKVSGGRVKGYAGYQEKTDRDIPLVILEPR